MNKDARKIPISYSLQGILFKYTWRELQEKGLCDRHQALILYQYGLLSIDPNSVEELEEYEKDELVFLTTLFFRSGLPHANALAMIVTLDKPYYYSFKDIFWDFGTNSFRQMTEVAEKYLESDAKDFVLHSFKSVLSDCNPEEVWELKDKLESYIDAYDKKRHEEEDT